VQKSEIIREPVHPECEKDKGCNRIIEESGVKVCAAYARPSVFWQRGGCALASHIVKESDTVNGRRRVGQQKQKKGR